MKRIWIILLFFIVSVCYAQNLVKNAGFEQYTTCPYAEAQISFCTYWHNAGDSVATSTADYFNECSTTDGIAPPNLVWGYQWPHSGNAFAHIGTFLGGANANIREYIQGELSESLIIGQKYYVSFFANLMGGANHTIASNKLGALFTTYLFEDPNYAHLLNFADIYTDTIITDTIGWFHVKGSFIADSAYAFITIANFFDNAHTDTINLGGANSIISDYNIDDVCVSTDSTTCYTEVGIGEISQSLLMMYPNPANDYVFLRQNNPIANLCIYNSIGQTIYCLKNKQRSNELKIDCSKWIDGLYFLKMGNEIYKIIIQH